MNTSLEIEKTWLKNDFRRCVRLQADSPASMHTTTIGASCSFIPVVLLDFEANACFLAIVVSEDFDWSLAQYLLDESEAILRNELSRVEIHTRNVLIKEPPISSRKLVFTRQVYFYCSDLVRASIKDQVAELASDRNLYAAVRDKSYALARQSEWQAFISYSSTDQATIVSPLVEQLFISGCPVWFDKSQIRPGDSLREKIEDGIRKSDRCIVVLSKSYLENNRYALAEFDSFFTKERMTGKKVFIPIWVDVSKQDVFNYSPSLADRSAVTWNNDPTQVANLLAPVLLDSKTEF